MSTLVLPEVARVSRVSQRSRRNRTLALLIALWAIVFVASLWTPPVLDDADGTHANAARQMALSGDYVTLRVNNVRYLEKAPLPYWIAATSIRFFGVNAFAVHLPQAIAVLLLMLLGYRWAREESSFRDMTAKVVENETECFRRIEDEMLAGPWVMGAQHTVCDAYLFTLFGWLEDDGVDIRQFPKLRDHFARMEARPAVRVVLSKKAA